MTDDFTTAARAEAEEQCGNDIDAEHFLAGATWARDHLAAQELEVTIRREDGKPATCEVRRNEELVFAGRDHSAELRVAAQEPTDVEIEAAARALHTALYAVHETEWEELGSASHDRWTDTARAALNAARATRRADR